MGAGDFVHVVFQRGDYVNRFIVSSPVHCHALVVVLIGEHALDRLLVDVTRTHFFRTRLGRLGTQAEDTRQRSI